MTKEEIRNFHKSKRRQLTDEQLEDMSFKIGENFMQFLKRRPAIKHIHIFLPIKKLREVNTYPLLDQLISRGYNVYTSILNIEEGKMETVNIVASSQFEIDGFGIPTPIDSVVVSGEHIQVVLIPLLAYDKKGNRLGYGKGYYDRFLSDLKSDILKIGVSFFDPIDQIPTEWHDIPLDNCITPQKVFLF